MEVTYNVYRDGVKVAEGLTDKTYTDAELEPDTTYEYVVGAQNSNGETLSDPIQVTTDEE